MPIDISKGLYIVKNLLFVLPFLSLTFIHYSYARIIKNIDNFSEEISFQSITDNTTTNRIMFTPNLAFKEVILKKILTKNKKFEYVKLKNIEILDLNETLKTIEILTRFATSTEKQTINNIQGYLSKARTSIEAKQYQQAVYSMNKAIEIYNTTYDSSYTLSFKIAGTNDWWFFAYQAMEIKTNADGFKEIYYLDVIDTNSSMGANRSLITTAIFDAGGIIDSIEQSSEIICKIYFSQSNRERPPSVFNIPANVIYEWKQIINSE